MAFVGVPLQRSSHLPSGLGRLWMFAAQRQMAAGKMPHASTLSLLLAALHEDVSFHL